MKYIVISGIDGSGKTTIIKGLQDLLKKNKMSSTIVWLRYNHFFVKPLHLIARFLGLSNKYITKNGVVWRHEFYKSTFFCWIYIWATYFDTILGKFKLKLLTINNTDYVICDRWINDILIDLGTKTKNNVFLSSKWFVMFKKLLPSNSIEFLIQRNKVDLLSCRLENQEDPEFNFRLDLYKSLSSLEGIILIDNNHKIDYVTKRIFNTILN